MSGFLVVAAVSKWVVAVGFCGVVAVSLAVIADFSLLLFCRDN